MSFPIGRRRVLLLSQLGTLLSWLIFLFAFALQGAAQGYAQSAGAVASIAGLIAFVLLGPGLFLFATSAITVAALLALSYRL